MTSLGKENRGDLLDGLGPGGEGNLRSWFGKVEGKSAVRDDRKGVILGLGKNLMQGKLSRIYKDDPS